MYNLKFRIKSNNVPILSKDEIDHIAEEFLKDFNPRIFEDPKLIDEDRFLTEYLGLKQDFQYLSHNGCYLGMIVFNDTDKVIAYDTDTKRAEYISAKAGTVIIDNTLLEECQEQRYRFTAMHEAGHWIFHRKKYSNTSINLLESNFLNIENIKCRTSSVDPKFKPNGKWNDNDTMEWQANYFASAMLMPKSMIFKAVDENNDYIEYLKFMSFGNTNLYNESLVKYIARLFNVSKQAAETRLNNLNIIKSCSYRRYVIEESFNSTI